MGVDHPGSGMSLQALLREVRRIAKATLQNASIGRAGIRVYDGGWIRIEDGGLAITGVGTVSGILHVTGELGGEGELDWDGPAFLRGATRIEGNLTVTGNSALNGDVTLNSDLTLGGGRIRAGSVTITPTGGGAVEVGNLRIDGDLGGTISSGGTVYIQGAGTTSVRVTGLLSVSDLLTLGKITAGELDVVGPKNFRMDHPSKPGLWLRHGSTESPVSGIEYWGEGTVAANGSVTVDLPDYFEALAKPDNRVVLVTGRGHSPDWSDITDGSFTVTGKPGGRFSWLVKAERFGGDFLLEEEIPADRPDGVGEEVSDGEAPSSGG